MDINPDDPARLSAYNAIARLSCKFLHQTLILLIHLLKGMVAAAIQRCLLVRQNRKNILCVSDGKLAQQQALRLDF